MISMFIFVLKGALICLTAKVVSHLFEKEVTLNVISLFVIFWLISRATITKKRQGCVIILVFF
ncbi:hypothetical protein [Bacillus sp. RC206]|uniref:hypothetical protein n=1 Tax=Bacillus sp. RC206 TaxID=3156281 RepID=UPI003832FA2F